MEAVQSRPLWRNPWVDVTLADNYRVGGYNVDYSGQASHAGGLSQQLQHAYSPSPVHRQQQTPYQPHHHHHHHHHHQEQQHPYQHHLPSPVQQHQPPPPPQPSSQPQQQQEQPSSQPPSSALLPGVSSAGASRSDEPSPHGHLPSRSVAAGGQKQPDQQHSLQVPLDLHSHRLGGYVSFGGPSSVSTPMYGGVSSPTPSPYASYSAPSIKRPRTDDFDLSVVDQSSLDAVQTAPMGASYGPPPAGAAASGQPPPMHHHHHLPDLGTPSKSMRREDSGGPPSMVGQVGMPSPAPRPRGPKLKFTAEDDQLLIELKEQKNLTWKQIADFFPGRSSGTLQVRYCTKLKAKTTLWTEDMVRRVSRLRPPFPSPVSAES